MKLNTQNFKNTTDLGNEAKPALADSAERLSISETFAKLREMGMGEYWDKVKCVCSELGRSKCEQNCKEYEE